MIGKLYINDELLAENAAIQTKYGRRMKQLLTNTQALEDAIRELGHEAIEINISQEVGTITIKTKRKMTIDERLQIAQRIDICILVKFISEEEAI